MDTNRDTPGGALADRSSGPGPAPTLREPSPAEYFATQLAQGHVADAVERANILTPEEAAAALALVVANTGLAPTYFHALHASAGGLSLLHWINDGLMALFFLLVLCTLIGQQCDHLIQLRLDPADAVIGASGVPGQSELLERRSPSFGRFRLALR